MEEFTYTQTLVAMDCTTCGVIFATTQCFKDHRMRDNKNFYCPNGHPLTWAARTEKTRDELYQEAADQKTENTRLLSHVDQLEAKIEQLTGQLEFELETQVKLEAQLAQQETPNAEAQASDSEYPLFPNNLPAPPMDH